MNSLPCLLFFNEFLRVTFCCHNNNTPRYRWDKTAHIPPFQLELVSMIVNTDSFNLNLFTAKGYTAQPSKVVMTIWSIAIGTLVQLPLSGILCMEVLVLILAHWSQWLYMYRHLIAAMSMKIGTSKHDSKTDSFNLSLIYYIILIGYYSTGKQIVLFLTITGKLLLPL